MMMLRFGLRTLTFGLQTEERKQKVPMKYPDLTGSGNVRLNLVQRYIGIRLRLDNVWGLLPSICNLPFAT